MAIIIKKQTNLIIRRGLDFPLSFNIALDLTGYTSIAECRESTDPASDLICNLGATVGTYNAETGVTPVSLLVTRDITAAITDAKGYWSLVLVSGDDIAEAYVEGQVTFKNDPTGATSDDLPT